MSYKAQGLYQLHMFFTGPSDERPRRSNSEYWLCSRLVSNAVWAHLLRLQRFAPILHISKFLVISFICHGLKFLVSLIYYLSSQFMLGTGGVVLFTRSLLGLKKMGIRANVLCPEVLTMLLGFLIQFGLKILTPK